MTWGSWALLLVLALLGSAHSGDADELRDEEDEERGGPHEGDEADNFPHEADEADGEEDEDGNDGEDRGEEEPFHEQRGDGEDGEDVVDRPSPKDARDFERDVKLGQACPSHGHCGFSQWCALAEDGGGGYACAHCHGSYGPAGCDAARTHGGKCPLRCLSPDAIRLLPGFAAGHMRPLGEQRPAEGALDVYEGADGPPPERFWREYVAANRPLLMRGAARHHPAMNWTEHGLATSPRTAGDALRCETVIEDRINPKHQLVPMERFFREYREDNGGRGVYSVSTAPFNMTEDVYVPSAVLCADRRASPDAHVSPPPMVPAARGQGGGGGANAKKTPARWLTQLQETNLWISHPPSKSALHFDSDNIVNCLYGDVPKRWLFFDTKALWRDVPWALGKRFAHDDFHRSSGSDYVGVNTSAVDLLAYPELLSLPYREAIQRPGDCVFIPVTQLHQVTKAEAGWSAAVSFMWLRKEKFSQEACRDAPLGGGGGGGGEPAPPSPPLPPPSSSSSSPPPSNVPLAAFDVLWYYSGKGFVPLGVADVLSTKESLLRGLPWGLKSQHGVSSERYLVETARNHVGDVEHWMTPSNATLRELRASKLVTRKSFKRWFSVAQEDGAKSKLYSSDRLFDLLASVTPVAGLPKPPPGLLSLAQVWGAPMWLLKDIGVAMDVPTDENVGQMLQHPTEKVLARQTKLLDDVVIAAAAAAPERDEL
jgi:hypothetical protein